MDELIATCARNIATLCAHFATDSRLSELMDGDCATRWVSPKGSGVLAAASFPGNVALHGGNATLCAYSGTLRLNCATPVRSNVAMCGVDATICDKAATACPLRAATTAPGKALACCLATAMTLPIRPRRHALEKRPQASLSIGLTPLEAAQPASCRAHLQMIFFRCFRRRWNSSCCSSPPGVVMKIVSSPARVPATSGQPSASMAQATTLAAPGLVSRTVM